MLGAISLTTNFLPPCISKKFLNPPFKIHSFTKLDFYSDTPYFYCILPKIITNKFSIIQDIGGKVFWDMEIKILKKGLHCALIQNKINKPELRRDFEDFARWVRLKSYIRNEPASLFSECPPFTPWKVFMETT